MTNCKVGRGDERCDVFKHGRETLFVSLCTSNKWAVGQNIAHKCHGDENILGNSGAGLGSNV
jgi:hypothetical protein